MPAARIDTAAMLREHEQVKKFVTELATSPLCAQVQRTLPGYVTAGDRACDDLVKSMTALGVIR